MWYLVVVGYWITWYRAIQHLLNEKVFGLSCRGGGKKSSIPTNFFRFFCLNHNGRECSIIINQAIYLIFHKIDSTIKSWPTTIVKNYKQTCVLIVKDFKPWRCYQIITCCYLRMEEKIWHWINRYILVFYLVLMPKKW